MGTFLVYIIKSAFCLTLLYLPYTLLLRGEKHHRLSRMALHVLSVAAFLLPLVQEEWFGGTVRSWQTAMPEGTYAVLVERLEQADVLAMPDSGSREEAVPVWPMFLVGLYLAGVTMSLAIRLWQWVCMRRFVSRGCLWKEGREGGITLYCHARPVSPFSWMHCIVMSEEDLEGEAGHAIYVHEKAHVLYGHSYDTLWMLAVEAAQWFNPVVWMMEMDMRCIHEYQADEYVLNQGINAKDYQLYLIKKAVGSRLQSFANGLTQSTLKKRIMMMTNKKTNKWAVLKYMYLLPVGAFATVAFARPEMTSRIDGGLDRISAVTVADLSATVKNVSSESLRPVVQGEVKGTKVSKTIPAKQKSVPAKKENDSATVAIQSEAMEKVVVTTSYRSRLNPEAVEFKEAVLMTDKDKSELQAAKDSASYYLQLEGAKMKHQGVYYRTETMPCYPGGAVAMRDFIARNIRYPKACQEALLQGTVYCEFMVRADGRIDADHIRTFTTEVIDVTKPVRMNLAKQLEAEAARIVKKMPRWTPGKVNGEPVDASYTIPVEFRLQ